MKIYLLGAMGLALGMLASPLHLFAGTPDFNDDFNGSALSAGWEWENPSGNAGHVVSDGALHIYAAKQDDQWIGVDKAPRALRVQRPEPWTVETRILANSAGAASLVGLILFKDAANWFIWGQLGNNTLEASGIIGNAFTQPVSTMQTKYAYLRIRRTANTYFFDASSDGINWTNANIYEDLAGTLAGARYGVLAKDWTSGSGFSYEVSFDFFAEYGSDMMPSALLGVANTVKIAKEIGTGAINDTASVDVCGADLGSMFELNGKTMIAFGDTFGCPLVNTPNWRSNTMAYTTDSDPTDGLSIDGWITGGLGNAKELFDEDVGAITAIPTYGISVASTAYLYYMQVINWNPWTCNISSIASSQDDGANWTKHDDAISWSAGNFNQVAIVRENPWLYIFGIPCGRNGSVKLMRVPQDQVLQKNSYEYFTGLDASSTPIWTAANEFAAATIVGGPVGELSVRWNSWLGRYIMMYFEIGTGIVMREAPSLWGPWGDPIAVATGAEHPALYGAYMMEGYEENGGESIYFRMSQYFPTYSTFWMKTTLLKRPVCEGDFDGDKDVDGADFSLFAADFGRIDCTEDCKGDFDADGDVDDSDLAIFSTDFGRVHCP